MSQPSIVTCKCDARDAYVCSLGHVYGQDPEHWHCPCLCHRVATLEPTIEQIARAASGMAPPLK